MAYGNSRLGARANGHTRECKDAGGVALREEVARDAFGSAGIGRLAQNRSNHLAHASAQPCRASWTAPPLFLAAEHWSSLLTACHHGERTHSEPEKCQDRWLWHEEGPGAWRPRFGSHPWEAFVVFEEHMVEEFRYELARTS